MLYGMSLKSSQASFCLVVCQAPFRSQALSSQICSIASRRFCRVGHAWPSIVRNSSPSVSAPHAYDNATNSGALPRSCTSKEQCNAVGRASSSGLSYMHSSNRSKRMIWCLGGRGNCWYTAFDIWAMEKDEMVQIAR